MTNPTIAGQGQGAASALPGIHLLLMSPEMFLSQPLPSSGVVTVGRSTKCGVHVDDPMASREHLRLHIAFRDNQPMLAIEDLGSINGTRLRDVAIAPNQRVPILVGDPVTIGSTIVMVMHNRSPIAPRRLWSHAYFEARLEDECSRAAKERSSLAVSRVRFSDEVPWTRVLPILARDFPAPNLFGTYGPHDYEILLLNVTGKQAAATMASFLQSCRDLGMEAREVTAWFPKDGSTAEALISVANGVLNGHARARAETATQNPHAASMARVRELAGRAASSPINVLILGECGVGKDVLARLIHGLSPRAQQPFVALNCAGLSDTLMDSELFGHERGAFTGASAAKVGLLESANGGTVFLDEIGDMPMPMQAKLLRVIETREVRPVGGLKARPIDVRFISATNKDLEEAVVQGEFRTDLVYRLNGLTLLVPPLRERRSEIPALAETFVAAARDSVRREGTLRIGAEAMQHLLGYAWPGNVRELRNMMERAVALCDGDTIGPEHLPLEKMRTSEPSAAPVAESVQPTVEIVRNLPPLVDRAKVLDRQRVIDALVASNGNQTRAAQLLGISRRAFVTKLDQYEIPRPQKGTNPDPAEKILT